MKSKIVFVLLCLWLTNVQTVSVDDDDEIPPIRQPAALKDNLLELLLEIRKRMHMEIPSLGLPILDPIKMDGPMDLNFESSNIGVLNGTFRDLTIVGIQGFVPNEVDFKMAAFPFVFNITVPQLTISGLYALDAVIGNMLTVTGEGDFSVMLTVQAYANGRLRFNSNIWTVPELQLDVSLENLVANFRGLYGGNNEYEDFINLAVSKLGIYILTDILTEMYPDYEEMLTDLVIGVAEGALEGKSVLDLMNIVNGNIELPPLDDDEDIYAK